jgi:hypothetical protein
VLNIGDKIIKAFWPLIDLIQGIAYPIAYIAIGTAICLYILGQRQKAFIMAKAAVVGYLAMQWLPGIMKILKEIGQAMAK